MLLTVRGSIASGFGCERGSYTRHVAVSSMKYQSCCCGLGDGCISARTATSEVRNLYMVKRGEVRAVKFEFLGLR